MSTNAERQAKYRAKHKLTKIEVTPEQKTQFLQLLEWSDDCPNQRELFQRMLDLFNSTYYN
jgi:hypothetical protein